MKTMFWKILTLALALLAMPAAALATSFHYTWEQNVGFLQTDAYASAPIGFTRFCKANPKDCRADVNPRYVILDAQRMKDLNTVNMDVNDSLFFNTDLAGRDTWQYPTDGYADCEDYALEKRKRLMDLGWPASSLLVTMAEKRNETINAWRHHVVLTVRTAQGDYVLDNEIRPAVSWDKAARLYKFTLMQTPQNPQIWATVNSHQNASIAPNTLVR